MRDRAPQAESPPRRPVACIDCSLGPGPSTQRRLAGRVVIASDGCAGATPLRLPARRPLPNELEDLAEVVAGKLVLHNAILDEENGGNVARRELGAVELIKIANGELGLPLEFVVVEGRRELRGIAAASPRRGEVYHALPATRKQYV